MTPQTDERPLPGRARPARPVLNRRGHSRWLKVARIITEDASLLEKQGSLACCCRHGQNVWYLRYSKRLPDGRLVQRGLYLGTDPELLRHTGALLEQIRRPWQIAQELRAGAALMAQACRLSNRLLKSARNARRRIG